MSQRSQRVSALLRESIQAVISKGLQDPRVRGLITVTKVTTADDLSHRDLVLAVESVLDRAHDRALVLEGLAVVDHELELENTDDQGKISK